MTRDELIEVGTQALLDGTEERLFTFAGMVAAVIDAVEPLIRADEREVRSHAEAQP